MHVFTCGVRCSINKLPKGPPLAMCMNVRSGGCGYPREHTRDNCVSWVMGATCAAFMEFR